MTKFLKFFLDIFKRKQEEVQKETDKSSTNIVEDETVIDTIPVEEPTIVLDPIVIKEVNIISTDYLLNNLYKYDSRYSTNYQDILDLINKLKQIAKTNNFIVFEDNSKDFNLNIWFSRNLQIEEDIFKDLSIVFWLDTQNKWNTRLFKWNTNPGIHYLQTPQNAQGTAIICTGQYRGTHSIRTHRANTSSAHQALCHSQGIVKVFRDNNRDNILDLDGRVYTNGLGINVHRPTQQTERTGKVDRSSAGCLIARYRNEFDNKTENDLTTDTFMGICRNSRLNWGNKFSITVIDDSMYK